MRGCQAAVWMATDVPELRAGSGGQLGADKLSASIKRHLFWNVPWGAEGACAGSAELAHWCALVHVGGSNELGFLSPAQSSRCPQHSLSWLL